MRFWALVLVVFGAFFCTIVQAQQADDVVWVQIEAQPGLQRASERARDYASRLEDVNGFALGGNWYGVLLGPYLRQDAEQVLRVYRAEGVIPRDSFIAKTSNLRQQFWPVGADVLRRGALAVPEAAAPEATQNAEPAEPVVTPPPPDETRAEARRSERALSGEERKELQVALQWAGFYNAAIDGAFGRGTRSSMAAWQEANGYEATGVLTTLQRAALIKQYNAVLDGLGLALWRDDKAGVEMLVPQGVVRFDSYDYPFARFAGTEVPQAQVLLISQAGTQDTLYGLYDIMQTLEIVPLDGPRERKRSSFTLTGRNNRIISHTEVSLENGEVKGFTLVWPAGDEDRRTRLLAEMRKSFARLDGTLSPSETNRAAQAVDLVAGLQIRRPVRSRSGFFVNSNGAVVTTLSAVQNCERITLDEETDATLSAADDRLGIAVLKPNTAIAPGKVARFSEAVPRLQSEIAVAGFSYGGILGAPTMSFGRLADLRGLRGEAELSRMQVATLDGDAGGPVFDEAGGVLGMLLPRGSADRQLPEDVSFAADGAEIRTILGQSGVQTTAQQSQAPMAPEDITAQARAMTVLVSCWE